MAIIVHVCSSTVRFKASCDLTDNSWKTTTDLTFSSFVIRACLTFQPFAEYQKCANDSVFHAFLMSCICDKWMIHLVVWLHRDKVCTSDRTTVATHYIFMSRILIGYSWHYLLTTESHMPATWYSGQLPLNMLFQQTLQCSMSFAGRKH